MFGAVSLFAASLLKVGFGGGWLIKEWKDEPHVLTHVEAARIFSIN